VELPPFQRAIEAGVDAVMVAHVTVPALSDRVATTSPAIITELLKTKMGFEGVVVTDALDMAALTKQYASDVGRAAVEAFKAGNDVLLIPVDLDSSWKAMVEAVRSGEVSEDRLDEAVLKLLRWKAALGLHRTRLVDVDRVPARVGRPQDAAVAQQAADDAVVLVRDEGGVLPLEATPPQEEGLPYLSTVQASSGLLVVVLSRDVGGPWGRELHAQVRGRVPGARVVYVDRANADGVADTVLAAADEADAVVVAAFVAPEPGERTADAGPGDPSGRLLQALLDRAASRTAVVAVGSPYVAQAFPAIQTYLCTFSNTAVSERSAVRALFGEIPLRGRLPVSINEPTPAR
jgi:beta-N-acetylhexosaminidase